MTIQQNNNGTEEAANSSKQNTTIGIKLVAEDTCKTSPFFGIISQFADTDDLIGPVTADHNGESFVFDFHDPRDASLYKVIDGDDLDAYSRYEDYYQEAGYQGDVSLIVDVTNCDCDVSECNCCGRPLVVMPWHPFDFLLDSSCTWALYEGQLCEFERENSCGYEVWHAIDPTKYHQKSSAE